MFFIHFSVPEYELVGIRSMSKRSASEEGVKHVHLSAFGRDVQLQLQRNDEFEAGLRSMKMYLAESTNNGIQYKEMAQEVDCSMLIDFIWFIIFVKNNLWGNLTYRI